MKWLQPVLIAIVSLVVGVAAAGALTGSAPGVFADSFGFSDPDMAARSCGTPRTYTVDVSRKNGTVVEQHDLPVVNCGGATSDPGTTTPPPAGVSVTDTGASPADAGNDTAGFEKAISQAAAGDGIVTVPAGTWRVYGLAMKTGVTLHVDPDAVITEYGSNAGAMINLDGGVHDTGIVGDGGRFTLDVDPADAQVSPDVVGIYVRDAADFLIENMHVIQNQSNTSGGAPDNQHAAVVYRRMAAGEGPTRGVMRHVDTVTAPRGYGPTQITGGTDLTFDDVSSDGGTAVRFETDGNGVKGVHTATVTNAVCTNGNSAFTLIPHGSPSSDVTVSGVTATSCDDGFRVREASSVTNVTVAGATITAGNQAMISNGPPGSAWHLGRSEHCFINENAAAISDVTCAGF